LSANPSFLWARRWIMADAGIAMRHRFLLFALSLLLAPALALGQAHFAPGVANIRDNALPETGLYAAIYNYDYVTSELTDNNGNKVNQVFIGNTPLNLSLDAKIYALSPLLLWVSSWHFHGANYGAYIAPSFSNANIAAALSTVDGRGINPETSQFAIGDLFVQPLWLGWNRKHFDVTVGYGFYAPVGKFDTQTLASPSGTRVITSATNVGLGYWTNQIEGNVTWYPSVKRGTAITNTITVEFNGTQRDTNFRNGDFVTWNWGASQYVPLDKQIRYLAELGIMGYSQWQVTDSSGPNVANPAFHEQVHGIGLQAGITSTHLGLQLNFHYFNEFYAANRFRGNSYSLNLGYTIKKPKAVTPPPA
jgi:hypothetical protein